MKTRPTTNEYWQSKGVFTISYINKMATGSDDTYYPQHFENINILKEAAILMYSQNPDAFQEFTKNYSPNSLLSSEEMQTFYDDILESQNYVLK
jgi:hypothetical protein